MVLVLQQLLKQWGKVAFLHVINIYVQLIKNGLKFC